MRGELAKLDLDCCSIRADGAEIVADFLKHDETVKRVYLGFCKIGLRGVKVIAESLKHNQTVEYLNLYANPLGDEGAEALIEGLNYNVCIKQLYATGTTPELLATIEYLTKTHNEILIPAAVRRASLCLIAARLNITNAGNLAVFPKEIVKMIAMQVYATRREPIWINALTESERTERYHNAKNILCYIQ